uniref:Uncharacterized protein n=1 Tax=Ditylenchus dipsaci TaxID=166011 RepID=A0A915DL81_9BILA
MLGRQNMTYSWNAKIQKDDYLSSLATKDLLNNSVFKIAKNNKLAVPNKLPSVKKTYFDPLKLYSNFMFLGVRGQEEYGCVEEHTQCLYDKTQKNYGMKETIYSLPGQKKSDSENSNAPVIDDFNIIKKINLKKCNKYLFEKEVNLFRRIKSPFIAKLKRAFMDGDDEKNIYKDPIVMIIELLEKSKIVKKGFMLRDFWLGHDGYLLLTDIDIGFLDDSEGKALMEPYTAPELLEKGDKHKDHKTANWWVLGAITYQLLTGKVPEIGNDNSLDFTGAKVSDNAKQFVTNLLHLDPTKRFGKDGIRSVKNHAFFGKKFDWQSIYKKTITPPVVPKFDKTARFVCYKNPKNPENFYTSKELQEKCKLHGKEDSSELQNFDSKHQGEILEEPKKENNLEENFQVDEEAKEESENIINDTLNE